MSTNGWGKGSVNNTNGWGAGAINNDIGWGDSQLKSWSGDTDIDGGTGIPVNTVAPVISGTTTLGSVLTTTNGTWTAKPAATFTYQWKRNGSNITGATNSTYTLVNDDGATNITCQVTATNDFGSASATSNTLAIPAFTDADAQAFITAAAITDPTQQSAINQLVTDLKGYGVWSKMKAVYPFVGGTASSHKFNLKDPRDLDAAFRLVFSGGWTHSSQGALPNGVNAFADTFLNPSVSLAQNDTHLSYYSRTNILNTGQFEIGVYPLPSGVGASSFGISSNASPIGHFRSRVSTSTPSTSYIPTDSRGLFVASRIISTQQKAYKNGILQATANINSNGIANVKISIGGIRLDAITVSDYTAKQCAFASIGDGLTDTEAANFYTAVQTFQVTLGRSIGTQTVSDADAQAFVTNAGIVDQVEANAVNNLVIGLKADGLWSKMKAVYPFVGSSATSNSYNLKNTAQFQITWNGGVTHSSTGVTFNGTNGFGNTGLNDSTILNIDNKHISMYQRNILVSFTGSSMGISNSNRFYLNFANENYSTLGMSQSPFAVQTPQRGMFVMSKTANGSFKYFQNALTPVTKTGTNNAQNLNYFIGASNNAGSGFDYTSANLAFVSIGDGLTDTDATNLNTKITTFQTTLNRQV